MSGPQPWTVALKVDDHERAEVDTDGSFDHTMSVVGAIIVALAQTPQGGRIDVTVETGHTAAAAKATGPVSVGDMRGRAASSPRSRRTKEYLHGLAVDRGLKEPFSPEAMEAFKGDHNSTRDARSKVRAMYDLMTPAERGAFLRAYNTDRRAPR